MAELALAYCASHTPLMYIAEDEAPAEQHDSVFGALSQIADKARDLAVDAAIIVSNEHFTNFFLDNFPQLCIGTAPEHYGPAEAWLGIEQGYIPGHPQLADHVLRHLLDAGYPLSFSQELSLDHGIVDVYNELDKTLQLPLIPIIQNCAVPPMLPPRHAYELGQELGRAIDSYPDGLRIAVIGAGGLSHDIGTPRIGLIDSDFDRWFLERLEAAQLEEVFDLTEEQILQAGNGAPEILSWLVAAGAASTPGTTLAYEPVQEWLTGMAVMEFDRPRPAGSTA